MLETKVEYRNTGVILDVTPHINEHGLVTMEVSQEVSNVGELLKVADKDYYTFNKRKVTTVFDGKTQSVDRHRRADQQHKERLQRPACPGWSKFRSSGGCLEQRQRSAAKSELIVMITPRVITSLDDVDAVSEEFKKKIGNAMSSFVNNDVPDVSVDPLPQHINSLTSSFARSRFPQ